MIRRLYVHNFRCLESFELSLRDQHSVLLIGKNGSGKTTVSLALEVLQKIGRGTNRVKDLVRPKDLSRGRSDVPMRFELEVELGQEVYQYIIAFEFPADFKELRVLEEQLFVGGHPIYTRELALVHLSRVGPDKEAAFRID
jgi:predicted ATP-binding protein involved in virulence